MFNSVFGDGTGNPNGAKLPAIHTQGLLDILRKFASQERKMSEIGETITLSEMWHETNDTKAKIIKRVSIVERFRCRGKNLNTPVSARW